MGKLFLFVFSYVGAFLIALALAVVIGFLAAVPAYFLWNWLMPEMFGLKALSYWQAWGLFLLFAILFSRITATVKSRSRD